MPSPNESSLKSSVRDVPRLTPVSSSHLMNFDLEELGLGNQLGS